MKRTIICSKCGKQRQHYARELCRNCYRHEPDQLKKETNYAEKYRKNNRETLRNKEGIRRKKYPVKVLNSVKRHYNNNKDKIFAKRRKRYHSDNPYKLLCLVRMRFNKLVIRLKKGKKYVRTEELIGTSLENLETHIASQFLPGMTWKNHGLWQIDHIVPCAFFDLNIEEEQKKCFHYTNLQPLWMKDNLSKSDKIDYDQKQIDALKKFNLENNISVENKSKTITI